MTGKYIYTLTDPRAKLETVGGKGASLSRLARAGLPIPDGFHITTTAYQDFVSANHLHEKITAAISRVDPSRVGTLDTASRSIREMFVDPSVHVPPEIERAIAAAYHDLSTKNLGGEAMPVAIRSSATAEDLPDLSFAGQQETYLNVCGLPAVLEAVKGCWASLWTARAISYRLRNAVDPAQISLAVVVQTMVPAESAGVLFTANPIEGQRDQVMINAAWGLGESIVSGLVTPDTFIVEKGTWRVIDRQIADKQVMCVGVEGTTQKEPVPAQLRKEPALTDLLARQLSMLGGEIEQLYGQPMDIEWAISAGRIYILQARPITTLASSTTSEAPIIQADEWPLPNPKGKYLRNNIVELMPDPLTPLFSTLGLTAINAVMRKTTADYVGSLDLVPPELIVTINGFAYYSGSYSAKQIAKILLNSPRIFRRMFSGMIERWQEGLARYQETINKWEMAHPVELESTEILQGVIEITTQAVEYYESIVSGLVPAAWMSEALFTRVYDRFIKQRGDPQASMYLLGYDNFPIRSEKALFDLAGWANTQVEIRRYLLKTPTGEIVAHLDREAPPNPIDPSIWMEWAARFSAHLQRYGGTIYDLDFSRPTPCDDPAPLIETLKYYLNGQAKDPADRQAAAARQRESLTRTTCARLKGPRRWLFQKTLARAQKYAPLREESLASIGLGYPLLRRLLRELGRRFAEVGAIDQPDDIFWMTEMEVEQVVADTGRQILPDSCMKSISQRKSTWQAQKRLIPPFALPPKVKILGISAEKHGTSKAVAQDSAGIEGIPCSPGKVSGKARVLNGPEDFNLMQPGEILVAGITTPAWTPLFAMASAIVTDVGGPLSHGSIVAREYGIPAVLGTGVATHRIHSGQRICVDGSTGLVSILE